jgi:hypothetical protein
MDDTTPESETKNEEAAESSPPRRRGRPRRQAFVKVETVTVERPTLPDPRWMAEFVAAFMKASQ